MGTADEHQRVTIRDVARESGVSITTVSHSLNGKGVVAATTRQRVVDAAARLGYKPDPIARGLRGHRLGVLGLVIRPLDTLDSYQPEGVDYFMRFAGAAAIEALDNGLALMLVRDPTRASAPDVALAMDGFIISDPVGADPVITLLLQKEIPFVTIGRDVERPGFADWLGSGASAGVQSVIAHFLEKGARRIALVTGTERNAWNIDSEKSYRAWVEARGQEPIVYRVDERSGARGGRVAADEILAVPAPIPDAIYCLTGRHAAGLQTRLQETGLTVPGDVMIAAGSDSEQTRTSVPAITSVDLEPEHTAKEAVKFLLKRLDGDTETPAPVIDNRLHVRESTNR